MRVWLRCADTISVVLGRASDSAGSTRFIVERKWMCLPAVRLQARLGEQRLPRVVCYQTVGVRLAANVLLVVHGHTRAVAGRRRRL